MTLKSMYEFWIFKEDGLMYNVVRDNAPDGGTQINGRKRTS